MNDFLTFLADVHPAIEDMLDRLLPRADASPARLHEAMRYSVFAGGKRIRPALVVLTGEALHAGMPPARRLPRETLLAGGAALEMIHTYSLIHDDLPGLDDDDLRRGRPTAHRRYDEAMAILAGDALLTLGLTTLAVTPAEIAGEQRCRAVAVVGSAIGTLGMIGGRVDDHEAELAWPADAPAALEAIHRRKTGALLVACLRLAGIYAGVDENRDRQLTTLGERLGLMFQVADDILDIEGTAGTLGKTVGKDAAARKLTYPGLYGLTESKHMLAQTRDEALDLAAELPGGGGLFLPLVRYLATRDR